MLLSVKFFVQSREHSDVYTCPCRTSCRLSLEDLETDLVQHPAGHGVSKKQSYLSLRSTQLVYTQTHEHIHERRLRTFTFIQFMPLAAGTHTLTHTQPGATIIKPSDPTPTLEFSYSRFLNWKTFYSFKLFRFDNKQKRKFIFLSSLSKKQLT